MIVVTGASGLVGSNLVRALVDQNQRARALVHRDRRGINELNVELVEADVRDLDSLLRAFVHAKMVFHLAGLISLKADDWHESEQINVLGTQNVIEACFRSKVQRLVYFSSIHSLQQEPMDIPVDESRPLVNSPDYPPYDRSKAAAEMQVRSAIVRGLDAVILNPTAIMGPYDYKPSFVGAALIRMAAGKLPALVNGGFDWVDVRDVCAAAIKAAFKARRGERFLLSGHWASLKEVATIVDGWTGRRGKKIVVPYWLAYQTAPLMNLMAQVSRSEPLYTRVSLRAVQSNHHISHALASDRLAYSPRPLAETIADTLNWFQENHYINSIKRSTGIQPWQKSSSGNC